MVNAYEAKQAAIEAILYHFTEILEMPGHAIAYANAIARPLWDAFPKGTRWHTPELFAEILAFHVIKATGLVLDQAAFRKASALGNMAMNRRRWLLHYTRYLSPAMRVVGRDPGIEPFLSRIGDEAIKIAARSFASIHARELARIKPQVRAGVCLLLAMKSMSSLPGSASAILGRAGIRLASTINAARRLGILARKSSIDIEPSHVGMATA